ncbi:MAG: CDP-alcohol phosphatidyltransferase family protein [Bacteroidales bacterium]|nr:CDP-alcohol phosphatidyltransferase family protein [Bacteroidales bacterium]
MKKHIPNLITCGNLVSGCVAITFALHGNVKVAALLIILSAVFDFFDGFAARMLKVSSPIGKDLDSLSDVVSFGVAPAAIIFSFLQSCMTSLPPMMREGWGTLLPYIAFIIPPFSALRLAKFNHDERQTTEFRGLATPANAMFIGFIPYAAQNMPVLYNFWLVIVLVILFSIFLLTDLPMFSLKFHHFKFKENEVRYLFLALSLVFLMIFKLGAFPIIILTYILISVARLPLKKKHNEL